jgi:hypothetical protein
MSETGKDVTQTPPQAPYGPPQGQMPYPPQGYAAPPAPPKKPFYKKTWFVVVAGLTGVAIVGSAVSGGGSADETAPAAGGGASAEVVDEAAAYGIGDAAADGKFSFVVNGVDCGTTEIGNEYLNTTAQGQFCIVDVTITNVGDEPQSFFGDNAKLFNEAGQEFSADGEAAIYLENSESLYAEINPGNSLDSRVVFDVPADMTPTSIELHDSAFSGGVSVALK